MAAVTITYPTLSNPPDKTEIEQNFTDVVSAIGSSAVAPIANASLANSLYEFVLTMTVDGTQWAAATDDDVVAFVGLPFDTTSKVYTIQGAEYMYFNGATASTASPNFEIEYGRISGGAWSGTPIHSATFAITASTNASAKVTLTTTTVTPVTAQQNGFAIIATDVVEGAGTYPFGADDEFLSVSLLISATLRAA